jgi:hypothetical protein
MCRLLHSTRMDSSEYYIHHVHRPHSKMATLCVCVCVCLSPMFAGLCQITVCPLSCQPRILSLRVPRVCRRHRKRMTVCVSAGGTGGGSSSSSSSSSHHHQQHAAPQQQFITIPLPMAISAAAAMQEAADLTKSRK